MQVIPTLNKLIYLEDHLFIFKIIITHTNHDIVINIDFKIKNWYIKIDIINFKIECIEHRETSLF